MSTLRYATTPILCMDTLSGEDVTKTQVKGSGFLYLTDAQTCFLILTGNVAQSIDHGYFAFEARFLVCRESSDKTIESNGHGNGNFATLRIFIPHSEVRYRCLKEGMANDDVVAVNLSELSCPIPTSTLNEHMIPSRDQLMKLGPGLPAYLLGCVNPFDPFLCSSSSGRSRRGAACVPIVRTGETASHPGLAWQGKDQGCLNLIDSIQDSGAPILMMPPSLAKSTHSSPQSKDNESGVLLLGIHFWKEPKLCSGIAFYEKSDILKGVGHWPLVKRLSSSSSTSSMSLSSSSSSTTSSSSLSSLSLSSSWPSPDKLESSAMTSGSSSAVSTMAHSSDSSTASLLPPRPLYVSTT